jgi:hypothetical protein
VYLLYVNILHFCIYLYFLNLEKWIWRIKWPTWPCFWRELALVLAPEFDLALDGDSTARSHSGGLAHLDDLAPGVPGRAS